MNKYAHLNKPQKQIDLHKLTRAEALFVVADFLGKCQHEGVERVLIITGKGRHSAQGEAILRPVIEQYLRTRNLNFQDAKPAQGGAGALFVRLTKN